VALAVVVENAGFGAAARIARLDRKDDVVAHGVSGSPDSRGRTTGRRIPRVRNSAGCAARAAGVRSPAPSPAAGPAP
jgi:hypothetical protein